MLFDIYFCLDKEESMFLVENFSKKLAARLKLPYYNIIKKVTNYKTSKRNGKQLHAV